MQPRVLQRRDLVTMAKLLKRARVEFCAAQDSDGTAEVDAALIKIKTDILVQAIDTARKVCNDTRDGRQNCEQEFLPITSRGTN